MRIDFPDVWVDVTVTMARNLIFAAQSLVSGGWVSGEQTPFELSSALARRLLLEDPTGPEPRVWVIAPGRVEKILPASPDSAAAIIREWAAVRLSVEREGDADATAH